MSIFHRQNKHHRVILAIMRTILYNKLKRNWKIGSICTNQGKKKQSVKSKWHNFASKWRFSQAAKPNMSFGVYLKQNLIHRHIKNKSNSNNL